MMPLLTKAKKLRLKRTKLRSYEYNRPLTCYFLILMFGATKDFLGKPAPANYVPGLARGARGFTTRADVGPAREAAAPTPAEDPLAAAARQMEQGGEEGLLGGTSGAYDREDEEADRIYAEVERNLIEGRRRLKRARDEASETAENQSVRDQFADLKHDLAKISAEEWMNIPEPGDLRAAGRKLKKQALRQADTRGPTSDLLIKTAQSQVQMATQIAEPEGDVTDFREMSKAKDDMLKARLDAASHDAVSGAATVDPTGYLSSLGSVMLKSDAELGDIKKARELLRSVVMTNPKHGPGWIAAARVEEIDGKLSKARSLIKRGCDECPKNEDVWCEAARLNTPEEAKAVLAQAVRQLPQSIRIWLEAMKLETDETAKKRVIRKALELIPNSAKLWKVAIEMESDMEDARVLLSRAVECVPSSVELWLALARLETYENAQKVLNAARRACPNSHEVWLAAAMLEESAGHIQRVDLIVNRAVSTLANRGSGLTREQWMAEAENCEQADSKITCQAIIRATIGLDVEEDDREDVWMDDAEACLKRGSVETARAIFGHALLQFPDEPALWQRAAFLEKQYGTHETMDALLQQAVKQCPDAEVLWLMGAKERWMAGDVDGARKFLMDAFKESPNSQQLWLAAIKLEIENGEFERGRLLAQKAREQAGSERIWMRSITLERNLGNIDAALGLLDTALERYPKFAKFYMIKGQIYERRQELDKAREVYSLGVKKCPDSIPIWIMSARLEETTGNVMRARAILDKARIQNAKQPELWHETLGLEERVKNEVQAKAFMSKALSECPTSGILWAKAIFLEPRATRKARSVDALKKCETDAHVIIAVARLFWMERNVDKARTWLNRAVKLNADLGDAWAWLYKFEVQHGDEEQIADVVSRCKNAEPRHGQVWQRIAKDPSNWQRSTEEVLKLTAKELE